MTAKHDYLAEAQATAAQHPGAAKRRFEQAKAELDALTPEARQMAQAEAQRQVDTVRHRQHS